MDRNRRRGAMRSRLVPLPSSVPPLSIPLGQGLISSSFPPVSSLLHRPSSLGVPLSSLLLAKAADGTCDLQPGFPGIFDWAPHPWSPSLVLWVPGVPGVRSVLALFFVALYWMAVLCVAFACVLLCASHCLAHIALYCLDVYRIASPCICFANFCLQCFALH